MVSSSWQATTTARQPVVPLATIRTVEIESLTIELDLTTAGTFGAANTDGGLFTVSSGVSADTGGKYVSGIGGQNLADAVNNVSSSGAEGRIGLITLNDIAENNTSGLIDAPRAFGRRRRGPRQCCRHHR